MISPVSVVEKDPFLPSSIIVDIDGTLALRCNRGIFEFEKSIDDTVSEPIKEIVNGIYDHRTSRVIILTGREECWREVTVKWLEKNKISYDVLLMRVLGDRRPSSVTKEDIWVTKIRGKYNVLFCLEDMITVTDMWRSHGLYVLHVDTPPK